MHPLNALARAPQALLIALVRGYRLLLSPWVGASCRFEPTCSRYALVALERHGALGGTVLTTWRVLRCHPLCTGGHDPVPDNPPWTRRRRRRRDDASASGLFTRLIPRDAAQADAHDAPIISKTTSS
jgi:putative membrane protein insertion efficiency factor